MCNLQPVAWQRHVTYQQINIESSPGVRGAGSPLAQLCLPCQSQPYARQSTSRTQHSAQQCSACCLPALLQPAYCREDHQERLLNIKSHTSICLDWCMCHNVICTCCECGQAADANIRASSCITVKALLHVQLAQENTSSASIDVHPIAQSAIGIMTTRRPYQHRCSPGA